MATYAAMRYMCKRRGGRIWVSVRQAILTSRENIECYMNKIIDKNTFKIMKL